MRDILPAIFFGHGYVIGTRQPDDDVSFPVEGVDGGSISMLCVEVKRGSIHA